ncbi:MAG: hypothetical protein GQ574_26065 [Crocinitomix sp.]|nr:hypothetical protein [Crocinitomix sp.]
MKKNLFIILILLSPNLYSQVSMDSIMDVLLYSKSYRKIDTISYLMKDYVRFESIDETNSYDVYLDSTGKLSEDLGLSMVYKEFDKEGRIIKRIGLNIEGYYSLWDYSPIIHTRYWGDSTTEDHFSRDYSFDERVITIKDSHARKIEVIDYDKNLKIISHQKKVYDDLLNELIISYYDSVGNIKPNNYGVAFHYLRFDPNDYTLFLGEQFFDLEMNLVEADHGHHFPYHEPALGYSHIKRVKEKDQWVTKYYNLQGKLICEGHSGYFLMLD